MLVETFPRGARHHFLVVYPFEGRLAHQTLGMLLTRGSSARAQPLGFVANDYASGGLGHGRSRRDDAARQLDLERLFAEDMLGDDLEAWLAGSSLMKRTFRVGAVIAGLIERRHRGQDKTGGR